MPRNRYGLHVTAKWYGRTVEETFAPGGSPLRIGNSDALAVPVPDGRPYIAIVRWTSPETVAVVDADERQYVVGPDDSVELAVGEVTLTLAVVRRFALRRTAEVPWRMSAAWATLVLAFTVLFLAWDEAMSEPLFCRWGRVAGEWSPRIATVWQRSCTQQLAAADPNGLVTAEYLARLLRKDYEGDPQGAVSPETIEAAKNQPREGDSFYLPAGAPGPATEFGGAERTAPQPERGRQVEPDPVFEAAPKTETPDVKAPESATPVPAPEPEDEPVADAEDELRDPEPELAEEKEGFGVPDWYDAGDKQMEQLEIDLMLRYARHRLAIDPDDPEALSILSYYQYLAEDYDGALKTYDKFIKLNPEQSAGYNNKALVYKRLGQYEKEEALYRVALSYEPNDETALNNLAVNLAHQGRFEEALAIMRELEVIDPGDPYADLHRSKIYAAKGDDEQALRYLDRALSGMKHLDTLHHIEFRQDIRVDPAFEQLRQSPRFKAILLRYYGKDTPVPD